MWHQGVLFLDEFTEFRRDAIEGLASAARTGKWSSRGAIALALH